MSPPFPTSITRRSRFTSLALAALTAVAVACADDADPTAPGLEAGIRDGDAGALALEGRVLAWTGAPGDSVPFDTLGRLEPVAGALVAAWRLGDVPADTGRDSIPRDSIPRDSVPRDSVPRDSVPRDSVPRDSTPDSTRTSLARFASSAARDSGGPPAQPTAQDRTDGDGAFRLSGLSSGIYRVEVTRPGSQHVNAWTWVTLRDSGGPNVVFRLPRR